jgi:putative flippase GtrA
MEQFLKFGVVGFLNTLITIVSFQLFIHFEVNYIFANIFAYFLGMTNSFVWNKNWVFREKLFRVSLLVKFVIVNLISIVFNTWMLYLLVKGLNIYTTMAQILSTGLGLVINFTLNKKWAFAAPVSQE